MVKLLGHLKTVTHHRHLVFIHCCKCGIPIRGLLHDLSKFSPTEFIPGVRYFVGTQSPNVGERNDLGYSLAWMHHKGRNRHHFEYWTDYDPVNKLMSPAPMPNKFILEMFCDRVAASKTYQKDNYVDAQPLMYYEKGGARRAMHPLTAARLQYLLTMLKDKGEDATFSYIRSTWKKWDTNLSDLDIADVRGYLKLNDPSSVN